MLGYWHFSAIVSMFETSVIQKLFVPAISLFWLYLYNRGGSVGFIPLREWANAAKFALNSYSNNRLPAGLIIRLRFFVISAVF
jgi:hypothetical protein